MGAKVRVVAVFMTACLLAFAQNASEQGLAHLLADPTTRQDAVSKIVASGTARIPLLLSWAQAPPAHLDVYQLRIGLADAFGGLRAKEAIPFLIQNISLSRTSKVDTWMKTAQVIEDEMPAVGALIRIGPAASRAIVRSFEAPMRQGDRLPAIFVVSQIRDPDARAFLSSELGEANVERYWAEEGLKDASGPSGQEAEGAAKESNH